MPATSQESAARRYRIEKYLTEGGMGAIYIGKKLGPGGFAKEVVLKQLLPEYTARPEFRDLFFREAKISATLDHANIVHTFDLVESDQSLFIVMEYVRGADLRTIIRRARHRRRELSAAAAIHVALEILAGLAYAHARRDATGKSLDIIHRDVSPSNIICSVQGAAKLSDFGIAKASTYSSVFYRVRGKVGYMSPEQARSQQIDHRCDLFSLSVCLYESLTGERLFVGDLNTPADEIYGIRIMPVSYKRPGLPQALDDVLARALAPNVEDRYQSAAELSEALRTVAHRAGLAFSAPELAAHLRDILGDDPERWLRDEPAVAVTNPQPPAAAAAGASELVGTEAASIGIVNDIAEDEPGHSVLSPKGVSGSKDFDLDSMLNDEATRPGGEERTQNRAAEPPTRNVGAAADEAQARVQSVGTPPPVWTRDSGPFGLATPRPVAATGDAITTPRHVMRAPPPAATGGTSPSSPSAPVRASSAPPPKAPAKLPGVRPAPPVAPVAGGAGAGGRPLPRATIRSAAVPPPFQPGTRGATPPPPAPPFPRAAGEGRSEDGIEEPTPRPPELSASFGSAPQASSFDIEDALTPPPPARPVIGPGVGSRGAPPAGYPAPSFEAPAPSFEAPAPSFEARPPSGPPASAPPALVLNQPQTMDFKDAVVALLPEKKGGPPAWLGVILILGSLVGGAAGAHRVTRTDVANALDPASAVAPSPTGNGRTGDDERPPAPAATGPALIPPKATGEQVPPPSEAAERSGEAEGANAKPARPAPRVGDDEPALDVPPAATGKAPAAARTKPAATAPQHAKPAAAKRRGGKPAPKRAAHSKH